MDIRVSQQQGRVAITVFEIHGDITADTARRLKAESEAAVRNGTRYLLIDLADVPYIASFGIRVLSDIVKLIHEGAADQSEADLRKAMRDGKGKSKHLKLLKPNPQVTKLLETTGLDMVLECHGDLEEAIASF